VKLQGGSNESIVWYATLLIGISYVCLKESTGVNRKDTQKKTHAEKGTHDTAG